MLRSFVQIAGGAYLYDPVAPGEKSRISILVMHTDGNFMNHSACTEMSNRGLDCRTVSPLANLPGQSR